MVNEPSAFEPQKFYCTEISVFEMNLDFDISRVYVQCNVHFSRKHNDEDTGHQSNDDLFPQDTTCCYILKIHVVILVHSEHQLISLVLLVRSGRVAQSVGHLDS